MYRVIKGQEPILSRYILAPLGNERLVLLYEEIDFTTFVPPLPTPSRLAVAVYRPTGRGPFNLNGEEGWEYEYVGVRIQ